MEDYKLESFTAKNPRINYENDLNPQQIKAVTEAEGPCLVLAGAGSGKTRVLIYRLAYLLEKGVNPQNILLVTFTNKASKEMIHRAESFLKMSLSHLWTGTFHHIGYRILRKEIHFSNYAPDFTIIDKEDSQNLITECLEQIGISKQNKFFPKKTVISNIWSLSINSLKKIDETINSFYPYLEEFTPQIKKALSLYTAKKREANILDFNDLLLNWLKLMEIKELKDKYSRFFQYVLVDEYQDTNRIQFEILKRVSSYYNNILAVGDDAQSIYSFRAADINNLLNFSREFKGAKIFKLETNYRSSPQILNLANEIIKNNINQYSKELTAVKIEGTLPVVVKAKDIYTQAKFVAQRILELLDQDTPLKEIAVLVRSRYQALELEVELLRRNIPYIVRGGLRFFEQAHTKDVLSYLKVITNPKDELSVKRSLCLHQAIGRGFAHKIWMKISQGKQMKEIYDSLPGKQKQGFKEFMSLIDKIKKSSSPEQAIRNIISSYKDYCYVSFDNSEDRILDLEELAKMARTFSTIKKFILDITSFEGFKSRAIIAGEEKEESLILSTIHQAKGLEWEVVFLIGFSDYDFPHPKALEKKEALEEERRLFYVATTRTKKQLYIVYPQMKYTFKNGLIYSRPSMFLDELSRNCYEEWEVTENSPDL